MDSQFQCPFKQVITEVLEISKRDNLSNEQLRHILELIVKLRCQSCSLPTLTEESKKSKGISILYKGQEVQLAPEELLYTRIHFLKGKFPLADIRYLVSLDNVWAAVRYAEFHEYTIEVLIFRRAKPAGFQ